MAPGRRRPTSAIGAGGSPITFNLGDVTNTNRDNAVPETVEIVYSAVVLNVAGNQSGTLLNNSAVFSWAGGAAPGGLGART